ncbi:unnamed protein product [Blepharisma stoltei]|uniref:Uncharacterized protein n=1 Tax=Blepharisma stoltei TaxID=1481888 RepID=A0AAU9JE78_9CILI|nr:unnamed protein product [Blepharisma stoltei]
MLDAPIPILVGTSLPVNYKGNLIWVLLDEKNCSEKIKGTNSLLQEVKIPVLNELRQKVSILYQFFKGDEICFNPSDAQISACMKIAKVIREFWQKIIDAARTYKNKNINSSLMHFLRQFSEGDHEFLMSMMETQLFSNIYQDFPMEENLLNVPKGKL